MDSSALAAREKLVCLCRLLRNLLLPLSFDGRHELLVPFPSDGFHGFVRGLQANACRNGVQELLVAGFLRRRLARRHPELFPFAFDSSTLGLLIGPPASALARCRYRVNG